MVSFFLASYSTSGGAHSVLLVEYPIFTILTQIIEWPGVIALSLFFGLFPNICMVPRLHWGAVVYFSIGYFWRPYSGL